MGECTLAGILVIKLKIDRHFYCSVPPFKSKKIKKIKTSPEFDLTLLEVVEVLILI